MRFEATYTPCAEDAVGSWRMHSKARGHVRLPWPGYVLTGSAVAAIAAAFAVNAPAGGIVLALGCFYSATLFYEWWLRLVARRQIAQPMSVVMDEAGVAITTRAGSHSHRWTEVIEVLLDDWGLVCYGRWGFIYVPSRAFAAGFHRDQLREFIRRMIKNA